MEARFAFRELQETSQLAFLNCMQTKEEKIEEWVDRVLTLATRTRWVQCQKTLCRLDHKFRNKLHQYKWANRPIYAPKCINTCIFVCICIYNICLNGPILYILFYQWWFGVVWGSVGWFGVIWWAQNILIANIRVFPCLISVMVINRQDLLYVPVPMETGQLGLLPTQLGRVSLVGSVQPVLHFNRYIMLRIPS